MVALGATATLFIIFLDIQCIGNENTVEDQLSRGCQDLIGKRKIQLHSYCLPVFKNDAITGKLHLDQEYRKFQNLCSRPKYPLLYAVKLLEPGICTDLNAILYSGFMDVISRLPPPGGTTALDIFRTVLITSYHLSSRFMKELQNLPSSLRVDIVFDADYEAVFGESALEFRNFLLWHLKRIFRRSHSDIHMLTVKKGSIGITFFVNIVNCAHSKRLGNRCTYTKRNHFAEQRKIPFENRIIEVNWETEFLSVLKYLNHHLNLKHYNLPRRIPYSVKTSSPEKSESFTEKPNLLDAEINQMEVMKNQDFFDSETISSLHNGNGKHEKMPEGKSKLTSDRKKSPDNYFRYSNLNLNRVRRYVAREDESVMKLKVQFKLEKPAKNGNKEDFQKHLVSQLAKAMRVPIPSIKDIKIASDTDVSFTLSAFNDENNVMDDVNVIEAADSLKAKIKSQKLRLRDLNGQLLMTAGSAYASADESSDYSLVILITLCITLLILTILIITIIYIARRSTHSKRSLRRRNEAYKNVPFGRDSSQSVGKYSYDSGLWLGPGPEPNFTVPEAPYYRPPTVEQISSTPRPQTAVRTRLKTNWNVDERALSTIPDDFGRNYINHDDGPIKR